MAGVGSWRRGLLAAVFLAAGAAGTSAQVSIFRPKIGVPEFALTGGTFRIEIEAASGLASNGWSVVVTHDLRGWTCAVERVEYGNYVYCDSLPGYRVTARAPGDIAPEVFNLVVGHTAAGGATNRHCVSILRYFETNFYILHYADPQAETDAATAANGAGGSHGSIQAIQWAACAFNLINPRFMFNTGDEVENGVAGYYPKYMDAVDAFTVPLLVTRGNNDAGYAFDSWKRDIGQPTYSITMGSFYVCMKDYNANEHLAWFTNDYAGSFTNTQISFRLFGQHFVGAGSAYNPPAGQYPDLMLVGHNHTFATLATSPYYILSSGPGWDYGVVGIFEFFKSGSGWTCSNKTIHGGANKLPVYGDWGAPRKVTNTFLRANDGTAGTNTAYITNSLAYDFWDGRVRFLMRKSAAGYTVTGGEKIAEYDYNGGTNTAVLVKVNIARQARTTVTVSDAPPDTTPPDLAIRFPTNAPVFRTGQSNILIAGTAADNSGITAVTFQVTGARVMSGAALTGPVTLIPAGAIWKYLDDGTDQGTAWRAPDFDDSTWSAGPAELGYGDGDEATVVSYGPYSTNKYITTYFRAVFLNPGPAVLTNALALRVNRDDGVVVYADGMEVFRDNLPAGPVTYLTPASSTSGEGQWFGANLACPTGATCVLAAEVHQANSTSSDMSFDLAVETDLGSTWWLTNRTWAAGANTITMRAYDLAGNIATAALEVMVTDDVDDDGIADDWEQRHFGAAGADPNSDADGDRLNNRQEFIAGTDPTNSRSLLMIGGGADAANMVLSISSHSGRLYNIYYNTNLLTVDGWQLLTHDIAGNEDTIEVRDPLTEVRRFYRIDVRRP